MAQPNSEPPRKRFTRSGHTTHRPAYLPPPADAATRSEPAVWLPPPDDPPSAPGPAPLSTQPTENLGGSFGAPTYHAGGQVPPMPTPGSGGQKVTVTRAVVTRTNGAARYVTRKVISASEADGARESGLTALIWNQVLSYGTDAMITVALAGTVFFGASTHAQRGNVLLYLLVTMAPFALVAPIIGPALDRMQHGRRWAMGGTAIGRSALAVLMAAHSTSLVVLYPCALGSLVLSKAYSVIRGAAAPRLVPQGMTLVEANARLSIFGLASALIGGGVVGGVIKVSGSYTAGLIVTAIAFAACGFFAFRLPAQIDSAVPARRHREEPPRPKTQRKVPPLSRLAMWAARGFETQVVTALQGESMLRFLSGFLTIFLAFYVETTQHGVTAAAELGAVVVAAGGGNFVGTGIGARLKLGHPEVLIMWCLGIAAAAIVVVAVFFSLPLAVAGMFVSAISNSLAKVALDAVIQRDVAETLRSSAFARSETFLQLAWVVGAALACLLPSDNGVLGFWIAGSVTAVAAAAIFLRNRAMQRTAARGPTRWQTGSVPDYSPPSNH